LIQDLRIYISEKIEPLLKHVENNKDKLHKKYKDLTGKFIPSHLENDQFFMFKLFVSHIAEPPSYNEKYIEARWKIFELEDLIKQLKGEI
jgi:hypothetical protein